MLFGLVMFATDFSMSAVDLGRAAEEHGFESLWLPEHTHIPASRRTPWPGGPDLPREYWHALDPFVGLGAVAAATRTLRLGTGICLVVERDPITTAKEVATLDFVSGGRFLFGIGAGWNREEMEHHGTDPEQRFKVMRERVLAMKEIWTKEEPSYRGRFVRFDPIWSWPKPVQRPHPPILIGGSGDRVLERVVEYGDGWMPIPGRGPFEERIAELQRKAETAGRGRIPVSAFMIPADPARVERYRDLGVERCIFGLPSAPAEDVLPRLRAAAEVARRFA